MTRILLVDDHPMMREGLRSLLEREPDMNIVGEAEDGEEAVARAEELSPEVVLMDIEMPRLDGIEATRRIRAGRPETKVVALTIHDEPQYVKGLIRAGACGYVLKRTRGPALVEAVRLAILGQMVLDSKVGAALAGTEAPEPPPVAGGDDARAPSLSSAEVQLVQWLADGLTSRDIGLKLRVSQRTVKGYVARLLEKLEVHTRAGAVGAAAKMGVLAAREAASSARKGGRDAERG